VAGAGVLIPKSPTGPGLYVIDPSQSEIRLLVYRAGVMATLGHNHVIINRSLAGWIKFTGDPTAASFAVSLPVADFIVDDVGARGLEGGDFLEEVPEDAKEGTRHNMLSAALLDADHYPTITLRSVSVTNNAGAMHATVIVGVAGHETTLVVPVQLATSVAQISASGSIRLRQTSLGLKPFSILMGSLKVQDEMTMSFTVVATIT